MREALGLLAHELRRHAAHAQGPLGPIHSLRLDHTFARLSVRLYPPSDLELYVDLRGSRSIEREEERAFLGAVEALWEVMREERQRALRDTEHRRRAAREEARHDPEIGGDAGLRAIGDFVRRYTAGCDYPELLRLFDDTGLGDNPVFLRFLRRVARTEERALDAINRAVNPPVFVGVDLAWNDELAANDAWSRRAISMTEVASLQRAYLARLDEQTRRAFYEGEAACAADPASAFGDFERFAALARDRRQTETQRLRDAEARAMELFKSWLTPEQLAQFERDNFLEVIGGSTGRRYRIARGSVQNVFRIGPRDGAPSGLCFAPRGALAIGDVMLAQKIALETDEEAALRVANRFFTAEDAIAFTVSGAAAAAAAAPRARSA